MIPAQLLQGKLHLLSSVNVVTDGASSSLPSAHFLSHFLSSRHLPLNLPPPPPLSILSHRSLPPLALAASCLFASLRSLLSACPPVLRAHTYMHACAHFHSFFLSLCLSQSHRSCADLSKPRRGDDAGGDSVGALLVIFFQGFFSPI